MFYLRIIIHKCNSQSIYLFTHISPKAELFVLALNSTYTKEQAFSWIEREIEADHKLADITDETLKIWESKLSKKLTPEQTTAAIKIMHGLRNGAKLSERDESLVS